MNRAAWISLLLAASSAGSAWADRVAGEGFSGNVTFRVLSPLSAYDQLNHWLDQRQASDEQKAEVGTVWKLQEARGGSLLERVGACIAVADERAAQLVETCSAPRQALQLPDVRWLREPTTLAFESSALRLLYARWLAHERLYDELLEQVKDVEPSDVVDPATLLFCQSIAYHRLLDKQNGLRAIDRLLGDVADVPNRYRTLATLMRVDLQALDEKNLDHIARRMEDIRRRLDLGRAGAKVCEIEDGVIKSLDELIKEMEKQRQQQEANGGGGGVARPSSPMQDSRIAPLKGPGKVDNRNIGNTAGWGDMAPKQREEALQQIGKDFPTHYRDLIEQYFRKLAAEGQR